MSEPLLIVDDCFTALRSVAPGSVQSAVTSPPYNMGREYESRATLADYASWLAGVIGLIVPTIAAGGSLCLQVGNYCADGETVPIDILAYPAIKAAGLKLRNRIVWQHDHGTHATKRFSPRYETVLWATKGEPYTFNLDPLRIPQKWPGKKHFKGPKRGELSCNPLGKNPGDVWPITQVKNNHPEKTAHPCQFPEELVRRLVLATTDPGDLVLDPFAGSGTVGAVCQRLGRRSLLIEREEKYAAIIAARLGMSEVEVAA